MEFHHADSHCIAGISGQAEVCRRLLETYRGERHIVGKFLDTGRYWATPPISQLDFARRRKGFTRDGRQFLLVGEPGPAAAADYFISLCAVFDERLQTTKDVTAELTMSIRQVGHPSA